MGRIVLEVVAAVGLVFVVVQAGRAFRAVIGQLIEMTQTIIVRRRLERDAARKTAADAFKNGTSSELRRAAAEVSGVLSDRTVDELYAAAHHAEAMELTKRM